MPADSNDSVCAVMRHVVQQLESLHAGAAGQTRQSIPGCLHRWQQHEQLTRNLITQLRSDGYSLAYIAQQLNRRGLFSRYGGRWYGASVRVMLRKAAQ